MAVPGVRGMRAISVVGIVAVVSVGCVLCMAVGNLRWKSRSFVVGRWLGGRRICVSYDLTFPLLPTLPSFTSKHSR